MTTPHKHADLLRIAAANKDARFMLRGAKTTYNLKGVTIFGVLKSPNKEWIVKPRVTAAPNTTQYLITICGRPFKVAKSLHSANMSIMHLRHKGITGVATPFVGI
jgi:hypothetical protein